jgi:opacity protein-like surface antigen
MFVAAALLALAAGSAVADNGAGRTAGGFYVSGAFGPNWDSESTLPFVNEETGLAGVLAIGTGVPGVDGLRVEIEGSFRSHESTVFGVFPLEHDTTALMVNGVYDINGLAMGRVVPYVLLGAGVAHTELTLGGIAPLTLENDGFAYQAGAGLNYNVSDAVAVGVGYRYLEAPEIEIFGFELDGGSNHAVMGHVTVRFD